MWKILGFVLLLLLFKSIFAIIGFLFGNPFILIAVIGVVIYYISQRRSAQREGRQQANDNENTYFLDGLSGMLAKIAKADGQVSQSEIKVVENVFRSLKLTGAKLKRCMNVFREAKDNDEPIETYAYRFTENASRDARMLVYEILWELAVADGKLSSSVDNLLRRVVRPLGIGMEMYIYYHNIYTRRATGGGRRQGEDGYSGSGAGNRRTTSESELDEAYRTLGCSPTDSDDAVRAAYRKQAKKYHPDKLRAEGLPESIVEKATQTMAKINNAWDLVRKARKM